jgi:uncharacterized lipoprotein YajG
MKQKTCYLKSIIFLEMAILLLTGCEKDNYVIDKL